jgi:hypothetical protein
MSSPFQLRFISALFGAFLLVSCTPAEEPVIVAEPEAAVEIPFKKLQGKWADTSTENEFYEVWETGDEEMIGTGVVMSKGDTVFIEHLGIVLKDSAWHYSARIDGHNNNELVYFKNVVSEDDHWLFENLNHDFPQQIRYRFRGADSLLITISGPPADSARVENFKMKKIQ